MHDLAAFLLIAGALAGLASVSLCLLILRRLRIMPTQADVQALADRLSAVEGRIYAGSTPTPLDLTPIETQVAALEAHFPPADSTSA